jgi:O-antigen/teichoic acid export membrane protein
VPFFKILCISGIFYPIHAFNINLLKVFGRSDLFLKLEITKVILVSISVFVGIKFGIYGLLWSSICSSFVALYINTYYSGKIFGYSFIDQVKNMFPILVISLITSFSMYLMLMFYTINSLLTQILVTGLLGMIIYITLCKLLYPTPLILLVNYIKKIRND